MQTETLLMISGAITCLAAVPFALPAQTTVSRSATVAAPASDLYKILNSNRGFQTFNPYKDTEPDLKIEFFGPEEGTGSGFHFDGKDGKGTQTIRETVVDERVIMDIDLGAFGAPVQTFELNESGDSTDVTWTVVSSHGLNPAKRIFGTFMHKLFGPTYDRGLKNLKRNLEQ